MFTIQELEALLSIINRTAFQGNEALPLAGLISKIQKQIELQKNETIKEAEKLDKAIDKK